MNWNLSCLFLACVVGFLFCLVVVFCVLFVGAFCCFGALLLFLFVLLCCHRDSTQDYVSVLYQFTFEATQPQMVYVPIINQLIPYCNME